MSQFRPTFFIPLFVFLGLAIIGGLALQGTLSGSRNPNQLPSVLIGKSAPDVPLPLLQNNQAELALDAYRGQPLLVNFFDWSRELNFLFARYTFDACAKPTRRGICPAVGDISALLFFWFMRFFHAPFSSKFRVA